MIYSEPFLQSKAGGDEKQMESLSQTFNIEFTEADAKAWKTTDYPLLAEYLAANQTQLDQLVAIADLPAYYAPILSVANPPSLMSADADLLSVKLKSLC